MTENRSSRFQIQPMNSSCVTLSKSSVLFFGPQFLTVGQGFFQFSGGLQF